MFKNTYQNGLLSIFFSCGTNPLAIWDMEVRNGHIKRITDKDVNSVVLELIGTNVTTTYIVCPKNNKSLGIRLPFLVMIVKDLKKYFTFEITVIDDKGMRRRFRISNFATTTKILPFCTTMPIGLSGGWNQIQFNLADFTTRAYGSNFVEVHKVQVHANTRLRRIYFSDKLYSEDELPQDYKLYLPMAKKDKKEKEKVEVPRKSPSKVTSGVISVTSAKVVPEAPKTSLQEIITEKEIGSEMLEEVAIEAKPAAEVRVDEGEAEKLENIAEEAKSEEADEGENVVAEGEGDVKESGEVEEVQTSEEAKVTSDTTVKAPSEATTIAPSEAPYDEDAVADDEAEDD